MLIHRIKQEFTTSISPERVLSHIRSGLLSELLGNDSEFFGYVSENKFRIEKNLRYKLPAFVFFSNSFAPIAVGKVEQNEAGATVKLKLRMGLLVSPIVFIIEIVALFGILFGITECLFGSFDNGINYTLSGLLIFFGFELLMLFAFKRPAKRMIKRLKELLLFKQDG